MIEGAIEVLCKILPLTFRENSNGSKNKGKHKNEGKY